MSNNSASVDAHTPRRLATGLVVLLAALALSWWLLAQIGEHTLLKGAEQIAQGHARFMRESTPGLDRLLEQRELDATTREQLARLRRLGEVYRFKLFDARGEPILASDHLDAAEPLSASRASWPAEAIDTNADRPSQEVLAGGTAVIVRRGPGEAGRPAIDIEASLPVLHNGRLIGVIQIHLDHSARFARMRSALAQVTLVVAMLLGLLGTLAWRYMSRQRAARQRAEQQARYLLDHDALSGLLNRNGFTAVLERTVVEPSDHDGCMTVLSIDLDDFSQVNEVHGHRAGDAMLRETAARLRGLRSGQDTLARLGADEFALMRPGACGAPEAALLAPRIVDRLAEPFAFDGRQIVSSVSVGVACVARSAKIADLLHQMEVALARAKQAGRGRFAFFDAETDRAMLERRLLLQDLRQAPDNDSLALHYQPLYDRDGRRLVGYEALMRWQHPERGMVPPGVFVPIAEESGQIGALGAWALETACTTAAAWPGTLYVAVNLSAAQFHGDIDLIALVQRCLASSNLAPERLVLEITESLLMSDTDVVVRTLTALRAMGVHVAMDDFGTGYSSLASLWRFPFDKVKIDRAFTKGLESNDRVALIVRSIVSLGHALGMRVTAEGVETTAEAALLRHLGCDELQGFLLGRPASAHALTHKGAADAPPDPPAVPDWNELLTQPSVL